MKKDLTEIVFILDRSGSMQSLTNDTIGGFNSMIEKQKKEIGEANVTTILFDDQYDTLFEGRSIKNIYPLTNKEYYARGMTALLDAVGKTINSVINRIKRTADYDRPSKVIFIIVTDGQENSSKEYTKAQIKEMINRQTEVYNWKFLFLGANIDAFAEAQSIGISGAWTAQYSYTPLGVNTVYCAVSDTLSNYRSTGEVDENWSTKVQ